VAVIHLVRHGQTDWNLEKRIQGQTDSQLTDLGKQQATEVANELKDIPFTRAYASSSVRARDTANIILHHHNLPLQLEDRLREIYLGDWEGNLYADIAKIHPKPHQHFFNDPSQFYYPGAETFGDVQTRALSIFNTIAEENSNEIILLVSHGIFIKSILSHVEGRSLENFWLPPAMSNCCHSIIDTSDPKQLVIKKYANLSDW